MLTLKNITKDYKVASSSVHALKGVSLEFRKSEFVCILGQSGCGKTTLLNIIGGLDHYTDGDLIIQGKSTKDFSDRDWDVYRNHRIGFIFQSYNLIPHQTVLGNVELALTIAGISREERKKRAQTALERVGLGNELNKKPNQLSGGQCQRVAIARALVNEPDILLADEPTGALDSETSVQIMELIKEIAGERLVIMVTHNPELAERYASRIVRLHDGLVESDSDPYNFESEKASGTAAFASLREKQTPREETSVPSGKKQKKPRARMSFLTSLALSAKNLLTKKGRTIITSVAGSIGIISVCLVLALSSGFNAYIKRTEEDMLSYYPVEVTESAFDLSSAMMSFTAPKDMPDMSELENKIYVDSFLTNLANGMAVSNNVSAAYLDYVGKMDKEYYSEIQYSYGVNLVDNLFTTVTTGRKEEDKKTQYMSLAELKRFYIEELQSTSQEGEGNDYTNLIPYANFFGNIVNKMPGTLDVNDENFGAYVKSQYDVVAGEFPTASNQAVLVVGGSNDVTDLTLAQLGLLEEPKFLSLFDLGKGKNEENKEDYIFIDYDEILGNAEKEGKKYVLYFNDEVYKINPSYNPMNESLTEYPFVYTGERDDLTVNEGTGIALNVVGILRLKEGLTYGCLTSGLNITEAVVQEYIQANMTTKIIQYMQATKAPGAPIYFTVPAAYLASSDKNYGYNYYSLNDKDFPTDEDPKPVYVSYGDSVFRHLGGMDTPNGLKLYATDFDGKDDMLAYLNEWNKLCEKYAEDEAAWVKAHEDEKLQDSEKYEADRIEAEKTWGYKYVYKGVDGKDISVVLGEADKITYTDRVGLLMGMMQTMLNVITYVLVAFTAISLVVSSVMIGIITYVSVVERVKEIGVLRSLGARKQDIRNLFNAETFIIGLAAGIIGIVFTYLISLVINVVILSLTGIANIAALSPLTAFIMVCVSILLTLISGLIPAQAAAKKDPVIALRTE